MCVIVDLERAFETRQMPVFSEIKYIITYKDYKIKQEIKNIIELFIPKEI